MTALLLMTGLTAAQAQGIRVHYKNGNTVDIPAALFDHMSPGYQQSTVDDGDNPVDPNANVKVEPLDMSTAKFLSTLQQAGMPIHLGTSAPIVNGTFSLKPTKLVKYWSANPEDYDDIEVDETTEEVLKFTGQSGYNVWVDSYNIDEDGPDYSVAEANQLGDSRGVKAVIVGSGSKFTAAYIITIDWPAYDLFIRMGYIISAEVSGNSLKDLYVAALSLDRDYNLLEYGIGCDGDGVSATTTWAPLPWTDDSRSVSRLPYRIGRKKAKTVKEEYSYTIYKTDGTELKVSQDELDYVETYEAEFDDRITQQIPQEYLSKMATHMPIYDGSTPPTVDGTFALHPVEVVFASDNYHSNNIADLYLHFFDQNSVKNTILYEDKTLDGGGEKTEMIIMGQGDNFTVFAVVPGAEPENNITYKMATIISGTMTANGIKNCYYAILMVDKVDPNEKIMRVGTYRIFKDGDGLASPSSWSARGTERESITDGSASVITAK